MPTLNYLISKRLQGPSHLWAGDLIEFFNIENILLGRGFEEITEGKIDETLINVEANAIFDVQAMKTIKPTWDFVKYFNNKEFRIQVKKMIYNGEMPDKGPALDYQFEKSSKNEQRFSKTLELLIAYLCVQELKALSASFGVKIKHAPSGGDFDCIANFQNSIFYFEVKSGNINNLHPEVITAFLNRHNFLSPFASILFLDYEGGTDKLDELVRLFKNKYVRKKQIEIVRKITDGSKKFYAVANDLLVVDIHNDGNILSNLRLAMQYIHRYNSFSKSMMFNLLTPDLLGYESTVI